MTSRVLTFPTEKQPLGRWSRLFVLDLRSLALFRAALGVLILAGIALRAPDFRTFFTDDGVWPVSAALSSERAPGMWSLHLLSGSFGWQSVLAVTEAAAGLALLVGWNTRLVTILAWVLVSSAQSRVPMIFSGAGSLLRQLLFWGMWLPLGARWSLDARGRRTPNVAADAIVSVAAAALLLQIAIVYLANANYKSDPAWRTTGEAISFVLSQQTYVLPAGYALLEWPGVLRVLTYGTLALEAAGPLLLFIPWYPGRWRLLAASLFIAFHIGLAATLRLGLFPFVSIAGWIALLPSLCWERGGAPSRIQRSPWPANVAASACLFCVLGWNLRVPFPVLKHLDPVAHLLRVEQRWAMFAPRPRMVDSWIVPIGTAPDGTETDLWTGSSPVVWSRPPDFAAFSPSHAWSLYLLHLDTGSKLRARLLAEWLARRWHREHPGAPNFTRLAIYCLDESIHHRGEVPANYVAYDSAAASE